MNQTPYWEGPFYGFHQGETVEFKVFGPYSDNIYDVEIYVDGRYAFTTEAPTNQRLLQEVQPAVDAWFEKRYHEWEEDYNAALQ